MPYNDRDDVLDAFREGRQAIDDFGLRRVEVYLRTRRWCGGASPPWSASTQRGAGYPVDEETRLTPAPRVRDLALALMVSSGGRYQAGDIKVDKITPLGVPGTGVELWPFTQPTTGGPTGNDERHVLLVRRTGTPWHVREGTERLLAPAPLTEAQAVQVANALRAAYPGHWSDVPAHLAADATLAPGVAATGWASALTLANVLRASWSAHRADLALHPVADALPLTAPAASDPQSTLVLLHDLLRVFNAHVAPGPVSECTVVEAHGDRAFSLSLIVRPTRRTP
jgi:hypothetical protein